MKKLQYSQKPNICRFFAFFFHFKLDFFQKIKKFGTLFRIFFVSHFFLYLEVEILTFISDWPKYKMAISYSDTHFRGVVDK